MASAGRSEGSVMANSDQSYMLRPATGAALYALELPPEGGETFWVDLRAAYAGLPRQLRARIAGKRAIFDYARRLKGYGRDMDKHVSEEVRRLTPPVTHALVCAHPETGDHSLYLDSTTTVGIDYMDTASGVVLLNEVYESVTREKFVYTHHWQVGDLVLWDNGFNDAPAHGVRPGGEAPDETDDDVARLPIPRCTRRQAGPI
jgi:alpha-ketoglutarate-dependent taurine dioxygenase